MKSGFPYWLAVQGLIFCALLSADGYGQEGTVESSEQVSPRTQTKDPESTLTKATTQVDENEFNQGLINNPLQLIQGRVEGLVIAKPGSNPNEEFVARIRGIQTIGVSSEPLIVLDGFPGADLNSVDPADIASIEVLKDIASSSLYGIRGGNGVILINTKSGQSGKARVRYRGSISFDMPDQNLSVMSANEYRGILNNVDFGHNTDWIDEITRTGISQVHNLSFSGGGERFLYYVAANYRKIEGITKNTGFESFNGRMNLSTKFLKDRGKIEIMMSTTTRTNQLGFNEVFKYAISGNPTLSVRYDGSLGTTNVGGYTEREIFDWFNPMSIIDQSVNNQDNLLLNGLLTVEYDFSNILKGLGSSFSIYNQSQSNIGGTYIPITSKFRNYYDKGMASRTYGHNNSDMIDTRVYLQRESSNLDYSITGGYAYQYFFNEGFFANGGHFLTDAFLYNNLTAAQDFDAGLGNVASYASSHKLSAFYGLLSMNFNENFFLDASLRREGSSRLGQDNKWHTFPSMSLGGRLDKLWNISGLDYLIGRISMGKAGRIPESSYLSLQRFSEVGMSYQDGEYKPSYGAISNSNPNLSNETTSELNIGFDFAFGSGKISGSFDWYNRKTKDMILPAIVPVPPNLYSETYLNLGELKNGGIELRLDWNLISSSKWNYSTNLILGTYSTEILSLTSGEYDYGWNGEYYKGDLGRGCGHATHRIKEGESLGNFWGPVNTGIIMGGMPVMADLNGDGQYCDCDDDMTVIGNGLPDWTLGWGHSITAGRFEVSLFFRGVFGHDLYNEFRYDYENTEISTVGNWNIVNTEYFNPSLRRAMLSDLQVENASFFTLDNFSIIYQFPQIPKIGIHESEVFITGQNLLTLTGYSGTDSEVRFTDEGYYGRSPDQMVPGIDKENTFLPSKTITLGLRIGL